MSRYDAYAVLQATSSLSGAGVCGFMHLSSLSPSREEPRFPPITSSTRRSRSHIWQLCYLRSPFFRPSSSRFMHQYFECGCHISFAGELCLQNSGRNVSDAVLWQNVKRLMSYLHWSIHAMPTGTSLFMDWIWSSVDWSPTVAGLFLLPHLASAHHFIAMAYLPQLRPH